MLRATGVKVVEHPSTLSHFFDHTGYPRTQTLHCRSFPVRIYLFFKFIWEACLEFWYSISYHTGKRARTGRCSLHRTDITRYFHRSQPNGELGYHQMQRIRGTWRPETNSMVITWRTRTLIRGNLRGEDGAENWKMGRWKDALDGEENRKWLRERDDLISLKTILDTVVGCSSLAHIPSYPPLGFFPLG